MAVRSSLLTSDAPELLERPLASAPTAHLGRVGLLGVVACGALISVSAAHTGSLLPESVRSLPPPLAGVLSWGPDLHTGGIFLVLGLSFIAYVTVVTHAERISPRLLFGAIAALYAIVLLAPPLFSTDVFSYEAYGRMGALYGASPYLNGPHAIALDPVFPYIGAKWAYMPSAYGPIFTALGYLVAPASIAESVLAYKGLAVLSALVLVALVWRAAPLRGVSPVRAVVIVGLNPLLVLYGLGGGHNDLLMLAAMAAAVYVLLLGRDRVGGGIEMAAIGVKLTGGLLLPFALAEGGRSRGVRPRRDLLLGVLIVLCALSAGSYVLFGTSVLHLVANVRESQADSDWGSIPGVIALKLGLPTAGRIVGDVLTAGFVLVTCWLLRRVWHGELDWLDGAGWATVALLVSAGSLLPWYVAWLLPFTALSRDARLRRATLVLTGIILGIQLLGYIPHGTPLFG